MAFKQGGHKWDLKLKFLALSKKKVKKPINVLLWEVTGMRSNLYGKTQRNCKGIYNYQANR